VPRCAAGPQAGGTSIFFFFLSRGCGEPGERASPGISNLSGTCVV
jgi:hypothetical protein